MNTKIANPILKRLAALIDWQLLCFLILFLNVKIGIKIFAIILIYLLRFNFRFNFSLQNSRLPLFYLLVIGIAFFDGLVYKGFGNISYLLVFINGIGFWLLCILAIHQVKLSVEKNSAKVLHQTLLLFFLLNALVSLFQLARIIFETGAINPYLFQGLHQKYFIGTGDFIKGLSFDVSITNSVINALGVIYFLYQRQAPMLLLCMAVLLLTGSNSLNILIAALLAGIFALQSNRDQKSLIVVCFAFMLFFLVKISPQNNDYVIHSAQKLLHQPVSNSFAPVPVPLPVTQRADSLLSPDERKQKIAQLYLDSIANAQQHKFAAQQAAPVERAAVLSIPQPNLNLDPYQEARDTAAVQKGLIAFIALHQNELPVSAKQFNWGGPPGKALAMLQMLNFFKHYPQKILTGDGIGNFSSKIAFKATNLGVTGGYIAKYAYISPDFLMNHLDVYLNFFSRNIGYHSVINSPNSVYFQLLGEYGLTGMVVFAIFYLGYFLKHHQKLSYGIPVLLLVLGVFFLEYWFEQLSVMVLVELLLLADIKTSELKTSNND